MVTLPYLIKGMRDYRALQVHRRKYILSIIESIYRLYGFEPLETPALEKRTTLTEKYGEEGEQLIFNVLKSGNFLSGIQEEINYNDYKKINSLISDKALRYDLTVPLIRHIADHQHQIIFPFRRYQIQPVWRADRPQKGRYREFLQCDADIVGSSSLTCEAEILKLIYDIYIKLGIQNFRIKISHRGILAAIMQGEEKEKEKIFCIIVDKLEKIGLEKVAIALHQEGFSSSTIESLKALLAYKGSCHQLLDQLTLAIGHTDQGMQALATLKEIIQKMHHLGLPEEVCRLEPTLARGLAYYTGLLIETTVEEAQIGSLGGGGRYGKLGDLFDMPKWTGVGFSFGIDRIYEIMEKQQLFNSIAFPTTEVLLANIEEKAEPRLLELLSSFRSQGIKTEIYPKRMKIQHQLSYANKKKIPFVILLGEKEYDSHSYTLKNMQTGKQNSYKILQLIQILREALSIKL